MDRSTLNVLQMGIGFFLVFTSFFTQTFIQELVLHKYASGNESDSSGIVSQSGFYSQAILYGVFTVANFLAAPIIAVITAKWAMFLGALQYTVFMAGFLKPTAWFLYLSSAVSGFTAALLNTGDGNYLTINSTPETITRNSGIFWALMYSSVIPGGIFLYFELHGATSIQTPKAKVIYSVFIAISTLGMLCLALLQQPKAPADDHSSLVHNEETSSTDDKEIGSYVSQNHDNTELASPNRNAKSISNSPIESNWKLELVQTFKLLVTREMLLMAIVIMYTGIELTFWSGMYSTCLGNTLAFGSYVHDEVVALNGIFIGLGELLGGISIIILGHKMATFDRSPIVIFAMIVHLTCFFLIYLNIPKPTPLGPTDHVAFLHFPNPYVALFCSFTLGLGDACWNTQVYSILGSLYPTKSASAFALYSFWQSLASSASFVYGSYLTLDIQLLILVLVCFVAALAFFRVEITSRRESVH